MIWMKTASLVKAAISWVMIKPNRMVRLRMESFWLVGKDPKVDLFSSTIIVA